MLFKYMLFKSSKKTSKIAKELSDLIVYCQTKSGGITMEKIRTNQMKYYNMSSTPHENMLNLSRSPENRDELIKYHETVLSRIYPKGVNVWSGNFSPIPHWKIGAQMVALNIQTAGTYLRTNSSMFRQNVLKPCLKKVLVQN